MRLVRSSIVGEDEGFCLGTVAVECTGAERAALGRLPDLFHPVLDVYEVHALADARASAGRGLVQLEIQLARRDAAFFEDLLWQRLRELVDRGAGDRTVDGTGRPSLAGV